MDYGDTLHNMIRRLLDGQWSVPEFRKKYYDFYLDRVPDDALSESEFSFFFGVHEKLDWVDESPDIESRSFGWIDEKQFLEWVRKRKEMFDRGLLH